MTTELTDQNFMEKAYRFQDRQAGISLIYDPDAGNFTYNAYCLETRLMKELYTVEHDYLEDALDLINAEFGSWEFVDLSEKNSSCGSCAAK